MSKRASESFPMPSPSFPHLSPLPYLSPASLALSGPEAIQILGWNSSEHVGQAPCRASTIFRNNVPANLTNLSYAWSRATTLIKDRAQRELFKTLGVTMHTNGRVSSLIPQARRGLNRTPLYQAYMRRRSIFKVDKRAVPAQPCF